MSRNTKTLAVIPARYYSTRFPGKPLTIIAGKSMIQHVWERAMMVDSVDEVIVATDDQRILDTVNKFGGKAILTSREHKTGTDRIVEVISKVSCEWVINIQGDEPLVVAADLERLIVNTHKTKGAKVSTLIHKITNKSMLHNPNIVKVVLDKKQQALYFSRSLIPYTRSQKVGNLPIWRHLGVYLFHRDFLLQFHQWPQSLLEKTEQLEQLRILENGESLLCVESDHNSIGVDVPSDVAYVEKIINEQ